jgi:hypothetical protein
VTNDLLGHSGLITHSVVSGDDTFNGVQVEGISANVADDDEPAIRITPSEGLTTVAEGFQVDPTSGLAGLGYDSYTIVLTRRPRQNVTVTAGTDKPSPEERAQGARTLAVSPVAFVERSFAGTTGVSGTTIQLAGHGFQEGDLVSYENRGDGASVGGLVDGQVYVISNPTAGTFELKTSDDASSIALTPATAAGTHVLTPAESAITLEFTPADWFVPQTVWLRAVDDAAAEGVHFANVRHGVISADFFLGDVRDPFGLYGFATQQHGSASQDEIQVVTVSSLRPTPPPPTSGTRWPSSAASARAHRMPAWRTCRSRRWATPSRSRSSRTWPGPTCRSSRPRRSTSCASRARPLWTAWTCAVRASSSRSARERACAARSRPSSTSTRATRPAT